MRREGTFVRPLAQGGDDPAVLGSEAARGHVIYRLLLKELFQRVVVNGPRVFPLRALVCLVPFFDLQCGVVW